MNLLRLSIHQTFGQIGMESNPGTQTMQTEAGQMTIQSHPAALDFESQKGELQIDSSAAWDALGKGSYIRWANMIYSQIPNIALQAIARIVEDGNRLAAIAGGGNALADLAGEAMNDRPKLEYVGEASFLNVKISYAPHHIETRIEPQPTQIDYTPAKVNVQYQAGRVNIYERQKNKIDIEVSNYDWYQ